MRLYFFKFKPHPDQSILLYSFLRKDAIFRLWLGGVSTHEVIERGY